MRALWIMLLSSGCIVDYAVVPEVKTPGTVDSDAPGAEDTTPADTDAPTGDTGAGPSADTGGPVAEPPADDCVVTTELIYLIDRDLGELHTFDPSTAAVQHLGEIDCSPYGMPASMGIARDGHALVRYSDDTLYDVDLATLDCVPTAYRSGTSSFGSFGMGYATEVAGGWIDHLYVANSRQVARLDTGSWQLSRFGSLPSQAELTGNSAGELWAFLPLERPAELRQISKTDGAVVRSHRLAGFPAPIDIDTFAFSAWGGEFWLFVRTFGVGRTSDLYRVDASGRMTLEKEDIGLNIVGAGSSTCAPAGP